MLPSLPIIPKTAAPLRQQVVAALRQSIISGQLKPGSRLTERELIERMDVSRTVIREALRQLESEYLVSLIPHKGPVVRVLTFAEAKDIYAIRAVLEGLAARLFVENADDGDVKELEKALELVTSAYKDGDPEIVFETKNHFYKVLFEGAESVTLSEMISGLNARIWRLRALGLGHPRRSGTRWRESIDRLRSLFLAIEGRDAERAERIIREEVSNAAAEAMRLLSENGDSDSLQSAGTESAV